MKTKIQVLLFAIAFYLLCLSNVTSQTILTASTSPGSWDDGPSAGIGIEKQENILYYGAEAYYFPQLNNIDYAHIIGRFGINLKLDHYETFKIFGGFRGGRIMRGGDFAYALLGGEFGIQYNIPNTILYGIISGSTDNRTDSKHYSNQDNITVNSVWVKIGIKL